MCCLRVIYLSTKNIAVYLSGYSITKNFVTELTIITVGLFTFVPEIQEFCLFACIGLVIDFYMQLLFYVPCLTLDMYRLDLNEKRKFSINLLKVRLD